MTAQGRYLAHQTTKRETLKAIMAERHSNRRFANRPLSEDTIASLITAADLAPSSCNRKAISLTQVTARDDLALLDGVLVGGTGWIYRAPLVLLLQGDPEAYQAPGEIAYMPYLDAGHLSQQIQLAAIAAGLHCCFVNPNVRGPNRDHFATRFGWKVFCGAIALGHPYELQT